MPSVKESDPDAAPNNALAGVHDWQLMMALIGDQCLQQACLQQVESPGMTQPWYYALALWLGSLHSSLAS